MVNLLKSITVYILLLAFLLIIANCGGDKIAEELTKDTTPPDTSITSKPLNLTNSTSANFSFTSTETATFECQMDSGGYTSCTSPKSYTGLTEGSHSFSVKAIDSAGNTDSTPASYTWTIDTTANVEISITSQPLNPTNLTSADFSFTSTETATFECQIDNSGYTACTSPKEYIGLAEGLHTFDIKATDAAGNTNSTPASYTWTIDTTAVEISITSQPLNPTNSISADFSFTSTETATFECQIDNSGYTACTSPKSYTGLTGGSHKFDIKATDLAGNTNSTPASYTWTIDITAPTGSLNINSGASYTTSTSVTLTLSATDDAVGVTGYYASETSTTPSASATGWTSITSTTFYSASVSFTLSSGDGTKTVYVWFKDAAGNVSSSASDSITLDTTPPTVSSTSPSDNATSVALSTSITATFGEAMDAATITASTFTLDNGATGTVAYDTNTKTATFTPSSNLTSGTTYTATITTSVKDVAGNKMASDKTWSFTTLGILTWDAPTKNLDGTDLKDLAGYKVYYGTSSGSYTTPIEVGKDVTTYGVKTLSAETTYYFTVTAYNEIGNESDYSTEVSKTIQ